jgi:hypothetical protein
MRKSHLFGSGLFFILVVATVVAFAQTPSETARTENSTQVFWDKFKTAVIKVDKDTVAGLSRFPISMPYGVSSVKNKPQLVRRFREVFNGETNAAKCFTTAKPEVDKARPKEFSIACKNAAGDEVIIYQFQQTRTGWKFAGLDNINE